MNNTEITTNDIKLDGLSNRYRLVETKVIANKFKELGFTVDKYQETRVRKASKQGFQKHLVSLSNPTLLSSRHKDVKLQLLVTNSHDGLSAFKINLGIYRLVCANGLMVGTTFESISLRHTGNIIEQVDQAVERMIAQVDRLDQAIATMKEKVLTPQQSTEFIARAIKLRYPEKSINDVDLPTLRIEDQGNNVFVLYNRIQESLVRGGNDIRNNQNRLRTARSLTSITALTKLNESLFDLSVEFANAS